MEPTHPLLLKDKWRLLSNKPCNFVNFVKYHKITEFKSSLVQPTLELETECTQQQNNKKFSSTLQAMRIQ